MTAELQAALLTWSATLPLWQQDLLRRLAMGETLAADELRAFANHIRFATIEVDAPFVGDHEWQDALELSPLSAEHLQVVVTDEDEVRITKLSHVSGANALAPGATLEFDPAGLTIIAGRNGSGKSGYTRILKQVCASRAPERVQDNAYSPGTVPSAVISYAKGHDATVDVSWVRDVQLAPTLLQRVRVFDKSVADAHLAGPNQIAYVPPVLQILSGFTTTLGSIRDELQRDADLFARAARSWPELDAGEVGTALLLLGTVEAQSKLKQLATLTGEEKASITTLAAEILALSGSDPARQVILAKQRERQLSVLAGQLKAAATVLTTETIAGLKLDREALQTAQEKLRSVQQELFANERLGETGSPAWQSLWRSAKAYMDEHAAPVTAGDDGFPDFTHPLICPLCQQDVEPEAAERFIRFKQFMSGEAEAELREAQAALAARLLQISSLHFDDLSDGTLADVLMLHDAAASVFVVPLVDEVRALQAQIANADVEDPLAEGFELNTRLSTLATDVEAAVATEAATAARLADADTNAAEVVRLAVILESLKVRAQLEGQLALVLDEHNRRIYSALLVKAISACDTTAASRKNGSLSQDYVNKVAQAFSDEAAGLGLTRAPVKLIFDRSERGVSYIKVVLEGAESLAITTVLSDGEQRMVAIAGFFADLTESGDGSTLVFDDPVSSLDQEYRQAVARRLLLEAETRQVLVFTHDQILVRYLYESKENIELHRRASGDQTAVAGLSYLHLTRTAQGPGSPTTDEFWRHVTVTERCKRLNQRIDAAQVLHTAGEEVAYEALAKEIVGGIRETWERLVEQVLLFGVVQRFERDVHTQKLRYLTDIIDADVATVELGMGVESRFMTGHDDPTGDDTPISDPAWLRGELNKLKDFAAAIRTRRNGV